MVVNVFIIEFFAILLLNMIPILGPPTFVVLSIIAFTYPIPSLPIFIIVALCAATIGRIILTLSAKYIIRNRFLGEKYRKNMDYLRRRLNKRPYFTSMIFFIEAFTPLPSDQFFIAFGLTGMGLWYAIVPFFVARIFTYSFWTYTASTLSKEALLSSFTFASFLSWPFLIAELLLLTLLYYFVKVDWEHIILHRRLKIIKGH